MVKAAKVTVYANHFPAFAKSVREAASQGVRKTAYDIMGDAIETSPWLTGNLAGSHFVSPITDVSMQVGNFANYAHDVHFGTRFMTARPWFSNAVEKHRSKHSENVQMAINKAVQQHAIH